ncbi:hypothetical protein B0T19DRAFT_274687 [Cercophora scortea]|uniref:Transmembrane protein n=1 Tax=Cercophora scortea TaxID=314031 RepID=A0AAE0M632_9PEZI|nr:hypothetical protein B0T19DRAFT_274687 [Cercophora scortea]
MIPYRMLPLSSSRSGFFFSFLFPSVSAVSQVKYGSTSPVSLHIWSSRPLSTQQSCSSPDESQIVSPGRWARNIRDMKVPSPVSFLFPYLKLPTLHFCSPTRFLLPSAATGMVICVCVCGFFFFGPWLFCLAYVRAAGGLFL